MEASEKVVYEIAIEDNFIPIFRSSTKYDVKFIAGRAYYESMIHMMCRLIPMFNTIKDPIDHLDNSSDESFETYLSQRPVKKQRTCKLVENYGSDT
jgi:hypothetical protein